MKKLILLALIANSALAQEVAIPVNEKTSAVLGTGYNSEKELNRGQCVEGKTEFVGKQESNFNLSSTIRQEELEKSLGIEAGFRTRSGATTYSGSAKFLKSSKSNSHTITLNYASDYVFKQMILSNAKLNNDIGLKWKNNPEKFKESCGDNFIYKQTQGAKLFYTLKITFESKEAKDFFEVKGNMSSSLSSAYASLKNNKQHFSKKTKVTFTGYQVGGDVSKLTGLLSDVNATKGENSAYSFVQCTFGKFEECEKVMESAINYATNTSIGFPSQLQTNVTGDANGPAIITNYIQPYQLIGEYIDFTPELNIVIKQTREKLSALFENVFAQQNKAFQLREEGVVRLTDSQKSNLKKIDDDLYTRMTLLAKGIEKCYNAPLECSSIYEGLKDYGTLYDENVFLVNRESFAQHCDFAQSAFSSEDLRNTVNALIDTAQKIDPDQFVPGADKLDIDICGVTDDILLKQEELDLSGKKIGTLVPLASLKQLKRLNLSFNNIKDLSPLNGLVNLVQINLNNNKLTNVSVLNTMENLEEINLMNNEIKDVSGLAKLDYVRKLDIRNNSSLTCPFENSKICYVLDLDEMISISPVETLDKKRRFHSANKIGEEILLFGGLNGAAEANKASIGELVNSDLTSKLVQKFLTDASSCDASMSPGQCDFKNLNDSGFMFHSATNLTDKSILIAGSNSDAGKAILIRQTADGKIAPKILPMNYSKSEHTATKLNNGTILFTGGWTSGAQGEFKVYTGYAPFKATARVEIYNGSAEKFQASKPMKIARAGHTATVLNDGRVLIIGGFNLAGKSLNTMEIFDPKTGDFTLLNSKLQLGRGYHKVETLKDGRVMVMGGYTELSIKDITVVNLEEAFKLDNQKKAEVDDLIQYPATASVEIIDPVSFKSKTLSHSLNLARGDHASITLNNGMILIAGGASEYNFKNKMNNSCKDCHDTIEVFDPETETFTILKDKMFRPVIGAALTTLDEERVLLSGSGVNSVIIVSP